MYGIIACSKFCDVHLLCSLICITYQAAHWMLTVENIYIKGVRERSARILLIIYIIVRLTYL